MAEGKTGTDRFTLDDIYPDAVAVFRAKLEPLGVIKGEAAIVLDTNTLLVPFTLSPQTLGEIRATYARLASEKRLFVPGQVAREFARNRATKLTELYQQLLDRKSKLPSGGIGKHPLLENVPEYQAVLAKERELLANSRDYGELLIKVADVVKSWTWNDPVSELYRELFTEDVVVDPAFDREAIGRELAQRFSNQIPPGYKDAAKPDAGIGDLLIWKTILEVAKESKRHLIFVSGEEKADWWYRSAGRQLYPRFELADEFRRTSAGGSLHIVSLSELLTLYGADQARVTEVRETERARAGARFAALFMRLPLSLREAVERLPRLERIVYLLAEVEGLSYKEIADILDIPVGTVGWRLFDARGVVGNYLGHPTTSADVLVFPNQQRWDSIRNCIEFLALFKGERILCRVSQEVLEDYFGVTSYDEALHVFVEHRQTFERIAREKLMVNDLSGGVVSIATEDLHSRAAG